MQRLIRIQFAAASLILLTTASRANVVFNLLPEPGTPQFAVDAFSTAANLWSSALANNITVNIQIGYAPLSPGVIGQAASAFFETDYTTMRTALGASRTSPDDFSSFASLPNSSSFSRLINHTSDNPNGANSGTLYIDSMDRVGATTANAKALGLIGSSTNLDALIRFSSNFPFDFNHGPTIAPGAIDFIGAAAHEIGHALGFVSGVDDIDYYQGVYPGFVFSPNVPDLFRYSTLSSAFGITDYSADTRDKYFSVDGGATAVAGFSTGPNYGDGRQASHWKDNLGLGLMDPTVGFGERMDFTPNDYRLMDVIGYTLVPEPASPALFTSAILLLLFKRRRA